MRVEHQNDIQYQDSAGLSRTFRSCAVNVQLCMSPHITRSLREAAVDGGILRFQTDEFLCVLFLCLSFHHGVAFCHFLKFFYSRSLIPVLCSLLDNVSTDSSLLTGNMLMSQMIPFCLALVFLSYRANKTDLDSN